MVKLEGGGWTVDTVGYASFFLYAGLLGVPAILLVIYLLQHYAQINERETESPPVA